MELESPTKNNKSTRIFVISLSIVSVLIIGLIITNAVIKINHNQSQDQNQTSDDSNSDNTETPEDNNMNEESYDWIEAPVNKDTYNKKIELEISNLEESNDLEAISNIYQKYIDIFSNELKDDETAMKLLNEKIRKILDEDFDRNYGDIIIADAISIDNILQTFDSATEVYNYASAYDRPDIMAEYDKIMQERAKNSSEYEEDVGSRG